MTKIIDGKKLSEDVLNKVKIDLLAIKPRRPPGLATVLVGDDEASKLYVANKQRKALELGFKSFHYHLKKNILEQELKELIVKLNSDENIDGILVQLPLPSHVNPEAIIELIDPKKDVDGIHPNNMGWLMIGHPHTIPCTPLGCLYMLKSLGTKIEGKHAVVVGRSNIVGKPMAQLLMMEEATVTVCHKKTKDLAFITKQADILIVAAGHKNLIDDGYIKEGVVIIDVGINRLANNKIVGDVNKEKVMGIASYISPVPGGVGPMTIAMLIKNTFNNFLRTNGGRV